MMAGGVLSSGYRIVLSKVSIWIIYTGYALILKENNMTDIEYLKWFYGLANKPNFGVEVEKIAKIRERQRRERKEKLYSFPPVKPLSL
jgi:hypothetical protein